MTGLKYTEKSKLLDAIENLVKLKSVINKEYEPWHKALELIRDMKIDDAAILASKACDKSFLNDPIKRLIVDEISNLAVVNDIEGPGIESLWSTAADLGYLDLAYNAGNQLLWKNSHKTVDDYKLAARYFQMAIHGNSSASIKHSAQTNYGEIIREGLITGTKDWHGAIALYEEAGDKGLVNAMFNAGNVLLWFVESGDRSYSARAQAWFERIIEHVESGKDVLDLGGRAEAIERMKSAKIRLAGMHIDNHLDNPSLVTAQALIGDYKDDHRVSCMMKRIEAKKLTLNCASMVKGDHSPWCLLFKACNWPLVSESLDVQLLPGIDSGAQIVQVGTKGRYQMTVLSFDHFTHPDVDHNEAYKAVASMMSERFNKPIFIVGKKGFFLRYKTMMFSVLHVVVDGNIEFVPIWPGASSDQVYETLRESIGDRFVSGRDDPMNTIPRLVNALDEGIELVGDELPNAIWLAVTDLLAMPIHRPDEPDRIGLRVTQTVDELQRALQENLSRKL